MEGDKRFAHIATDPKFRRIPKGERKVKIDKRFQSMFKDKQFKVKYTVDKRGRPVSHSTTEDLKRYYDLDSDDEDDDEDDGTESSASEPDTDELKTVPETINKEKFKKKKGKKDKSEDNSEVEESDEEVADVDDDDEDSTEEKDAKEFVKADQSDKKLSAKLKKKLKNLTVDYARGEGQLLSESSSDDDDEGDESEEDEEEAVGDGIDHKWGDLDGDSARTEQATYRLAACNMDWDRIRAIDLMVLFNSFLPPGGSIKSVDIYPSEYGKQRMAEEEVKGPTELVQPKSADDYNDGNQEGAKYHMEKLRQYQLNRLKYYYTVITCDSPNSASKIYSDCDGMEYESSATKIDLRFIPDDLSFVDDVPKESCSQLPELTKYKPRFFTTTALQQAKVDLTWDETNPDRIEIAEKLASGKLDDIAASDLQAYLASSSGEESDNQEEVDADKDISSDEDEDGSTTNPIDKYKMLLQEIDAKEKAKERKDIGMEITWGIDLQKKTDKLIKDKKSGTETKSPFEQFLDKRKEKRKEKRAAKKESANNENDEDDGNDSDMPADIDMNDPYFAEEFNKSEFKQKSKSKSKNKKIDSDEDSDSAAESKAQLELLLNDDEDDGKQHFSLKKIQDQENDTKSKKKRRNKNKNLEQAAKPEDEFQLNVNDERFSALFTSHHYNIDPTDPHYKKTNNMQKLINEKIKRRTENDDEDGGGGSAAKKKAKLENVKSKANTNAELNVLVKSVKRKAQAFNKKK